MGAETQNGGPQLFSFIVEIQEYPWSKIMGLGV
jgi:hypothetical protein